MLTFRANIMHFPPVGPRSILSFVPFSGRVPTHKVVVDVELLGFVYHWGLQVNAITVIGEPSRILSFQRGGASTAKPELVTPR